MVVGRALGCGALRRLPRLTMVDVWARLVNWHGVNALRGSRPLRHLHVLHGLQLFLAQLLLLPLILHVLVQ